MPRFSVWAIRSALLYFGSGFTFGALILINKSLAFNPEVWRLLPLHIEFLLFGWLLQLVFGIGYWIFPRFKFPPKRGRSELVWGSYFLLNLGIVLVSLASLLGKQEILLIARMLETLAVGILILAHWTRAKPTETGKKTPNHS